MLMGNCIYVRPGLHVALRAARTEDALQVAAGAEQGSLLTPLPGTVVAVHVAAGQRSRTRRAPGHRRSDENGTHLDRTRRRRGGAARLWVGDRVQAGAVLVELSAARGLSSGDLLVGRSGGGSPGRCSFQRRQRDLEARLLARLLARAILPPASCT